MRPAAPLVHALAVDVALLALFAVQHNVMARPAFKQLWVRIVPTSIERATYVLASSLVLLALFALWEPLPGVVWSVESPAARAAVWALYTAGWVVALTSTFLIDHFHLFGLKQAAAGMKGEVAREPTFRKVLLYRLVRHPLMVGFLVAFWAAPTMSVGRLVFALAMTAYVLVGVRFEERDLRAAIGPAFATTGTRSACSCPSRGASAESRAVGARGGRARPFRARGSAGFERGRRR